MASISDDEDLISNINITPLVDVVLVILVIFLITAPVIYQSAIKVQLPSATTGEESDRSPLEFSITEDGAVIWGQDRLTWEALETRLKGRESNQDETAIINADTRAQHGRVVRLMDLLRKHGLVRFALSVDSSASK